MKKPGKTHNKSTPMILVEKIIYQPNHLQSSNTFIVTLKTASTFPVTTRLNVTLLLTLSLYQN